MALTPDQWKAVRRSWEYDPDKPTHAVAGKRAGEKFGFSAPSKQAVAKRAAKEGWERKSAVDMASVNAAAQRKADGMPEIGGLEGGSGPEVVAGVVGTTAKKGATTADAGSAASSAEDAENLRAAVLKRHREEWVQVAALRQEAVKKRHHPQSNPSGNDADAFLKAKLAKITAEATAIQQAGERKAWGLDIVVDPEQMKNLSDEQLQALAAGKVPSGMR